MKIILSLTLAITLAYSVNIRTEQQRLVTTFKEGVCPNSSVVGDIFGPNENAGKPPSEQDLEFCSWYSGSTCCTPSDASTISASLAMIVSRDEDKACYNQLNLLLCGSCSPIVAKVGELEGVICTDFCNKIYDACKDVTNLATGQNLLADLIDKNETGVPSKQEFCAPPYVADVPNCFNGASTFNMLAILFVIISCLFA